MSELRRRLTRIEQVLTINTHRYRPQPNGGAAREKLVALVRGEGGQLPGESLAAATARVLGIPERELMNHLRERAAACR